MHKSVSLVLAAATFLSATAAVAQAPAYPAKPIRMIVPFAAGGTNDVDARTLAKELSTELGKSVIVENVVGAAGSIGAHSVVRATPDGYTILFSSFSPITINPHTNKNIGYDSLNDLIPISQVTYGGMMLAVHPSVPVKTVPEFIQYLKAQNGKFNAGNSGNGGSGHLAMALFAHEAGIKLTHVPYKGSAPALNDLIAGHVQAGFNAINDWLPHARSGSIRPIMVTTKTRPPEMPEVPTAEESGLTSLTFVYWSGVFAPKGTPKPVLEQLNKAIMTVLAKPAVREKLQATGNHASTGAQEEFVKTIREDYDRWGKVVRDTGIRAE